MRRGSWVVRKRGDRIVRTGTVVKMDEHGWIVVVPDLPVEDDDGRGSLSYSSGSKGTPADGGWEQDPSDPALVPVSVEMAEREMIETLRSRGYAIGFSRQMGEGPSPQVLAIKAFREKHGWYLVESKRFLETVDYDLDRADAAVAALVAAGERTSRAHPGGVV
jgi:hypothetical protein